MNRTPAPGAPPAATPTRRRWLNGAGRSRPASHSSLAMAPSLTPKFDFKPNPRYPDPAVLILDPSFARYRIYSSSVEQLGSSMRWAEGPAYFPADTAGQPGYLLCSDIPNNRLMKFDEATNQFRVHKQDVNYANGNARDRQGRLITCEHSVTRRIVLTEKDGSMTVLADRFEGKRLNAPNDIVVKSDDTIWFTDPLFGINGEWEGARATPEQATTNVYRLSTDGKLHPVQEGFWEMHGLQCGYCTPGMIMTAVAFLKENPKPSEDEIRHALEGNLCRCTGYHNIVKAVKDAAAKTREGVTA